MLLELLIAMVVLVIGLGAILVLLVDAMYTNKVAGNDTSSTMIAEHVIEQISAQQANDTANLSVADCVSNTWTITTVGAAKGAGNSGGNGGNGATLSANGTVDWSQDYGSVPDGYKMRYVACGPGAQRITYDVRWNVINMFTSAGITTSRMIFVSARPSTSATVGGLRYIVPANLRTIGGM
jgi:type II secretory pathway pseudopilin PulG